MKVRVDSSGLIRLDGRARYAVSRALNQVAKEAQEAEREHMKKVFRLRREAFVLRGVKIARGDWATKTSLRVVIQLAYPDQRRFMEQHEEGGIRTRHGGKRLWQPNEKVFRSRIIGRSNPLHPKNLHLRKKGGAIQGDQRTFLVRAGRERLILQRIGSGGHRGFTSRSIDRLNLHNFGVGKAGQLKARKRRGREQQTRLLYRLVERVKIPARLEFVGTIDRTVAAEWQEALDKAWAAEFGQGGQ